MKSVKVFIFFISVFVGGYLSAQNISVVEFEDIEKEFQKNDDTVRVINFWATWCVPCVEEMPYFVEAETKFGSEKVKFLYISLDLPKNIENKVVPFVDKQGMQGGVVLLDDPDANTWINKVDPSWSGAIPATVIYKGDNKYFIEGSITLNEIDNQISQRLEK
ncbi:MAG: TlpA family protein disulfide reductase [Bacteroidales bacterium]|nr:TlpA family protein disulfide reductase [Bacteroidales bacterium]